MYLYIHVSLHTWYDVYSLRMNFSALHQQKWVIACCMQFAGHLCSTSPRRSWEWVWPVGTGSWLLDQTLAWRYRPFCFSSFFCLCACVCACMRACGCNISLIHLIQCVNHYWNIFFKKLKRWRMLKTIWKKIESKQILDAFDRFADFCQMTCHMHIGLRWGRDVIA